MIHIYKSHYDEIIDYSLAELPNEACGLLAGRLENEEKRVEKVYFLRNIDESPEHFSMDPKEQFAAVKDMRVNGWVLLGNFHSHPATPARPSREDIRLAFDPSKSYMILSLAEKQNPVLKSFLIVNKEVSPEDLVIGGE